MRRCVTVAFFMLAALFVAAPAHAQEEEKEERLSSLLEGRVSFTLPASWTIENHINTKTNGRAQLLIPYPEAELTPHRASGRLVANTVPEGVTVRHLSDGVYKNNYEGLQVLSDEFDGDNWRMMVWTIRHRGLAYIMLSRFGLTDRTSVELGIAIPLLEELGNPKWIERTVSDFNALSASLKIDGRNKTGAVVKLDKIPQPQKVNAKP